MTNTNEAVEAQTKADLALLQALWDAQKAAVKAQRYALSTRTMVLFESQLCAYMKVDMWDTVGASQLISRVSEILEQRPGMTVVDAIDVYLGWKD